MSVLDSLVGALPERVPPLVREPRSIAQPSAWWASKDAVEDSRDLERILELPVKPAFDLSLVDEYTRLLSRPNDNCTCAALGRPCVKRFNVVQAQAIFEMFDPGYRAGKSAGLFAPISVGGGKTLLDLIAALVVPACKRAVLFIPAQLRNQLLALDWELYGNHWRLPNLAGGRFFTPGLPVLHVIAYSELSHAKSTDLLEKLVPDLIIADEAHNLRKPSAARTKRFRRYFKAHPATRFVCWSGTLTSRSIKDYGHLADLGLGEGSPVPTDYQTLEQWAKAIDPSDFPLPLGALRKLCQPGEHVREGFRRRLLSTKGVVASGAADDCKATLIVAKRSVASAPQTISVVTAEVERTWQRPDQDELTDALSFYACLSQLASGFYYRFIFPRGEDPALIEQWKTARADWRRELRLKLKMPRVHLDSPLLCTQAAIRYHKGGYDGPLPVWNAVYWPAWHDIRKSVGPETQTVWIDEWLARDAAAWAVEKPGIVWFEYNAFGDKVAELSGCTLYGAGEKAGEAIAQARGDRSIVASRVAHGTGKNLQFAFSRNLFGNLPVSNQDWEQCIGRTHRPGQPEDEVTVDIYQHTDALVNAFKRVCNEERYVQDTMGTVRKLNQATLVGL